LGAQGLAWRQDYPPGFDHHLNRQELYDMRDRSGLARVEFFNRYFGIEGDNILEVGDHVGG
jgi:hypothetical protein